MGSWSIATSYRCSASAGVMLPIGSRMRRLLNQSTHSRVAYSTASKDFHGPRLWITSALNRPLMVSASASSISAAIAAVMILGEGPLDGRDLGNGRHQIIGQGNRLRLPGGVIHNVL